jgi:4-aminobutyrate aminotransferase
MGKTLLAALAALADEHACLARPRGLGLMAGVDVVKPTGEPDPACLDDLLESLKEHGFLCGKTGADRNVLTIMPPLIIERSQMQSLVEGLRRSLADMEWPQ